MNTIELKAYLHSNGIKTASIVDDTNDLTPTASAVGDQVEAWNNFEADRTQSDDTRLQAIYPRAMEDPTILRSIDEYVAAVYNLRNELEADANAVFTSYEASRAADQRRIQAISKQLSDLGLACTLLGVNFEDKIQKSDLVVIDLFLGSAQDSDARQRSVQGLKAAVSKRRDNPPLVLLISNNTSLKDYRDTFRDDVHLLESGFRILQKNELDSPDRLNQQLERLAANSIQTRAFAAFLDALRIGVSSAADRAVGEMRKLKLSDINQLQQLLLDHEGEPTGSYLVDVFDRSLQHEIEREPKIIETARVVDSLKLPHYAPHAAGTPNLPMMVARVLSQGEERWKPVDSNEISLRFGDVLQIDVPPPTSDEHQTENQVFHTKQGQVGLVITAACDLLRDPVSHILFMTGHLKPVSAANWKYSNTGRTHALSVAGELSCIEWDAKDLRTVSWEGLRGEIASMRVRIIGRLRTDHALSLQQKSLAAIGRIGLPAMLPASAFVKVEAFYVDTGGKARQLQAEGLLDGGSCFTGRDKKGETKRSVTLTERGCETLFEALSNVRQEDVAQKARPSFLIAKNFEKFNSELRAGLPIHKDLNAGNPKVSPAAREGEQPFVLVYWGDLREGDEIHSGLITKAGLVLNLVE